MTILRSKLTFTIALGFMLMFGVLGARMYMQERGLRRGIAKLEADIAKAEGQNKELVRLAEYFSKPEHLEKEAKIRFNLKRPDEEVLMLSSDLAYPSSATANSRVGARETAFSIATIGDFFKSLFTYSLKE